MSTTLITGGTLVQSDGEEKTDVLIEDGVIKDLGDLQNHNADTTINASDFLIMPGLIDCHVHFREPGFEHKATMASEALSARRGGILTVCEMPNTNPPATSKEAFADKCRRADGVADCDIRFFFGITEKEHIEELKAAHSDQDLQKRLCGVKIYLDHSTGNQKIDGDLVEDVFKVCSELGLTLVAHCEDPQMNADALASNTNHDIEAHSITRPSESEAASIKYAIGIAKKYGTHFHVAHLSTREGLELVRQAKKDGLPVTCEVTPHHLFLSTDDYKTLGTLAKMNPPLRTKDHQEALWAGITDGTVDAVSTDHAPHTLSEKKTKNPLDAPNGVPGVETMLPLLLQAASEGKLTAQDIVRLCFENPNTIFSLGKQNISKGSQVHLVLIDPSEEWTIQANDLHFKCGWTPFEGMQVHGRVKRVL